MLGHRLSDYRFARPNQLQRVAKAAGVPSWRSLIAQAAAIEPALAKAIEAALASHASLIDISEVAAALEKGDVESVMQAIGEDILSKAFNGVGEVVQDAAWAAGAAVALKTPALTEASFAFNRLNPRLIDHLRTYSLNLIREINARTRDGVRSALVDGMKAGENPRTVARTVKEVIGLTEAQVKAVGNFRKELESFHLKRSAGAWNLGGKVSRAPGGAQVLALDHQGKPKDGIGQRRLRDFRHDSTLARAMKTGKALSAGQINKMVGRYRDRMLRRRAETIARTEAARANAIGVQDAWRQAIDEGRVDESLVRRQWIVADDERLCPICAAIPGDNPKEGVEMRQPFVTGKGAVMLPPVHPNCRCAVFIRSVEPQEN